MLQKEDYEHVVSEMKAVVGIPPDTEIEMVHGFDELSADELLTLPMNLEDHQDILLLKKQAEIAELQKKQSNRWWTPAVDVYEGYALYTFRQRNKNGANWKLFSKS